MTHDEVFKAWAPSQSTWSAWVKPVLFSRMLWLPEDCQEPEQVQVEWAGRADSRTGLVLDLAAERGVVAALSLARIGFRPVPLYNGLLEPPGVAAVVDVRPIMRALAGGAPTMAAMPLRENAPPAFLLDAGRRGHGKRVVPGMFDNRSISLPGDFPSVEGLKARGIHRMILVLGVGWPLASDLAHTLRKWSEGGIDMMWVPIEDPIAPTGMTPARPRPLTITSAPAIRLWWYWLLARTIFRRDRYGGFGGIVPHPSSG